MAPQGEKHIVGIGKEVVLSQLVHIIAVTEPQAVDGKLLVKGFLGCEGILQRAHVLELAVIETIGHITAGKPVSAQIDVGHAAQAQPQSLQRITADDGVQWSDVKTADLGCRHIAIDHDNNHLLSPIEEF